MIVSGQWRLRSDCADAQADLCLRCPHMPENTLSHGVIHIISQTRNSSLGFESHSARNSHDFVAFLATAILSPHLSSSWNDRNVVKGKCFKKLPKDTTSPANNYGENRQLLLSAYWLLIGPLQAEQCLQTCAKCADSHHHAHTQSLIRAFFSIQWFCLRTVKALISLRESVQADLGRGQHRPEDKFSHNAAQLVRH